VEVAHRNTYAVRDSRIARAYEGVSPDGHAETLLADVQAPEG
jgi:peroxiredoxin